MDKLVLPYLGYVQAEFADTLVNVGIVLRRDLSRIRDFTAAFDSKHCNKDLMSKGSRHVYHIIVAKREDEQLIEEWILDVFIDLRVHTAPSELYLYECSAFCKPGRRRVPDSVNLAYFNDHPLRNGIIPATYSFKVQVASHKIVLLLELVLNLLECRRLQRRHRCLHVREVFHILE